MTGGGVATVARQEFTLRIRAGRWRWLLSIWFAIVLLFTVLLRAGITRFSSEDVDFAGTIIYGSLMLFVLGLALLVVPSLAAQSINGDRERGTLATLQVTRLTAGDIALGKFAAAWGTALVFVALTLPLVGYAMTQNGVPFGRVVVVTLVIALLLGTVCALSLLLSSLLSRTTTSGVLSYLVVFALSIGTLVVFGLVSAVTTEQVTESYEATCPTEAELLSQGLAPEEVRNIVGSCAPGRQTYQTTRPRTDRTWWLLSANPFVVLADAAPQLPPETLEEQQAREAAERRGEYRSDARDLDPLGNIGSTVRDLRDDPRTERTETGSVWPTGLAINVVLAALALLVTTRRLRTPSRALPKGQRVA